MSKVRLVLPEYYKNDIDITLPQVPQIGSEFSINGDYYKVESINYEILPTEQLGQISIYLEKI
jgi:hypothetical protein